jgi:hypothetical protein
MKLLRKALHIVPLVALSLIYSGCGGAAGTGSTSGTGGSAQTVSVGVAPTNTMLTASGTVQFSAAVSGASNTAVSWSVASGAGTVTSSGLYTAPASAGTAAVMATSVADPSKTATATVTITAASGSTISVGISPSSTTTTTNGTAQFAATVSGTTNTAVTWSATAGTISSTGLYTAPSTAGTSTVKATSAADPTKSASASVSVSAPVTVSVSVTPNNTTVTTNGTVQFTAAVTGSTNTAVTWSVASGGGTVSTSGLYTAPSTAGTATVLATSVADPRSSALANVTINAPVTVLLSASPTSVAFGSVLVGASASHAVTLSNTGNSAVTVSSASFTGSGFGVSGLTFPFTLAAAASKNASLTFAPSSSGPASGSVSFVSNATNSPATVALSGSGTAPVQHTAMLSWQGTSTATGYNVYRSTVAGGPYTRLNSTLNAAASYADSTVASGKTYYYVVTEVDSSGMESGYSSQVTAVIPTP